MTKYWELLEKLEIAHSHILDEKSRFTEPEIVLRPDGTLTSKEAVDILQHLRGMLRHQASIDEPELYKLVIDYDNAYEELFCRVDFNNICGKLSRSKINDKHVIKLPENLTQLHVTPALAPRSTGLVGCTLLTLKNSVYLILKKDRCIWQRSLIKELLTGSNYGYARCLDPNVAYVSKPAESFQDLMGNLREINADN